MPVMGDNRFKDEAHQSITKEIEIRRDVRTFEFGQTQTGLGQCELLREHMLATICKDLDQELDQILTS